jgi:hypothetical protein
MTTKDRPCLCVLALELRPGTQAARVALDPVAAAELAGDIARDLAALVPDAAALDLAVLGAHYDPVELLRQGWPLHAALDALALRAPSVADQASENGRVLAFGTHGGALPDAVPAPDVDYMQGALRLLPFLLRGDADAQARVAWVAESFEQILIDRGMAGAATALQAQDAFGATIEHARYLTIHDLAALMAMQYEHAGLASLWPLVEAALLAPDEEVWLDAPPEPLLRLSDGEARIALLDAEAWRAGGFAQAGVGDDLEKLERAFEQFEARQRQFATVLAAHAIPVTFDHCPLGRDPRELLRQ